MKTNKMTINGLLAAVVAVLGYIALDMGNIKITFESFPVYMAAMMFGPVDGMLVGGIGTFLYQIVRYGFSVTTPIWILPYIVSPLIIGLMAKRAGFANADKDIRWMLLLFEFIIMIFNTFALYIDSKIFGYYSPQFILGSLGMRFSVVIIKSIAFGIIAPGLLKRMAKITHNGQ